MTRPSVLIQDALILAVPYIAAFCLFYPLGAFPANDDFLYARSVERLVDRGEYVVFSLKGDVSPSAVFHVLWGALISRLLGFSFHTLHIAVLVQAWMGTCALYGVARALGNGRGAAIVLALALLFCPLYFGHAFTFMTDTPAVAWSIIALAFFLEGIRRNAMSWRVAGSLATLIGYWIRQTTLGVTIFPAVAEWHTKEVGGRRLWMRLLADLAIPFAGVAAFHFWLTGWHGAWRLEPLRVRAYDWEWIRRAAIAAYGIALLSGFLLLPTGPLLAVRIWRQTQEGRRARWAATIGAVPAILLGALFLVGGGQAYLTNATGYFMQNAHWGPIIVSDSYEPSRWGDMGGVAWPAFVWQILTVASIANFGLLSATACSCMIVNANDARSPSRDARFISAGLLFVAAISVAFLLVALEYTFDRYWMVILAPLFVWIAQRLADNRPFPRSAWAASILLLAGMVFLDVVFTHDYRAWNGARWAIVNRWLAEGAEPAQIDGGYEVNAWFRSWEDPATRPRPGDDSRHSRWWAGHADRFVANAERPGFRVIDQVAWRSWATGRTHVVWGLREDPN